FPCLPLCTGPFNSESKYHNRLTLQGIDGGFSAMNFNGDPYPSRTARPVPPRPRQDPLIHTAPSQRRGPLDADEMDAFARDGFLILDGLFSREETTAFTAELRRLSNQDD